MQINISYYICNSYFMYFNTVHGKKMSGSNSVRLNRWSVHSTLVPNPLCVIQFQFLYVPVSTHYNIQSIIVTQRNMQPSRRAHSPKWTFGVENACNA